MPNATLAANAAPMPNRRAALGALAAGAMLALPRLAKALDAQPSADLDALFDAHQRARKAYADAATEWEEADFGLHDDGAQVVGIGGGTYSLKNGKRLIATWLDDHAKRLVHLAEVVAAGSPGLGEQVLGIVERERSAARGRLDEAFAPSEAARASVGGKLKDEQDALLAICAYRCATPDETARRLQYIGVFQEELTDAQTEALFATFFSADGPSLHDLVQRFDAV